MSKFIHTDKFCDLSIVFWCFIKKSMTQKIDAYSYQFATFAAHKF